MIFPLVTRRLEDHIEDLFYLGSVHLQGSPCMEAVALVSEVAEEPTEALVSPGALLLCALSCCFPSLD